MNEYFNDLNIFPTSKVIKEMRKFAIDNKVPVINDEGLQFMLQLVELVKPIRFLEIGTAIAFCAINIATYDSTVMIDTIEKNEEMVLKALQNVKNAKFEERIHVFHADALEFDLSLLGDNKYDMIFIDAAKAQYIKFFEKYQSCLTEEGIIVSDNLLFHELVGQDKKIESKNLRNLVDKIDAFNHWLAKNKLFKTSFFAIGDGIAISKKVSK